MHCENHYYCYECDEEWIDDNCDSFNDDECPECRSVTSPYASNLFLNDDGIGFQKISHLQNPLVFAENSEMTHGAELPAGELAALKEILRIRPDSDFTQFELGLISKSQAEQIDHLLEWERSPHSISNFVYIKVYETGHTAKLLSQFEDTEE